MTTIKLTEHFENAVRCVHYVMSELGIEAAQYAAQEFGRLDDISPGFLSAVAFNTYPQSWPCPVLK